MNETTNPPSDEQGGETGQAPEEPSAWSAESGPAVEEDAGAGEPAGTGEPAAATGREWLAQLQSMIDNVATHAAPVVRQVAAKAAELAAVAGEKAGPIAHKAAEVTEKAGVKVAERGREVAAELRRDGSKDDGASKDEAPNP